MYDNKKKIKKKKEEKDKRIKSYEQQHKDELDGDEDEDGDGDGEKPVAKRLLAYQWIISGETGIFWIYIDVYTEKLCYPSSITY